ncbi:peroxiredoxin-2-like [Anthonomus grandis grandis]|uniref:peroxiredoxin-2-like n=1 Tax=Anthonomus grandis grandis TaxID=2921223 RepID=UPI00216672D8|nr:peroxiredoxin-2-like [Anthonomus grandis grandis]
MFSSLIRRVPQLSRTIAQQCNSNSLARTFSISSTAFTPRVQQPAPDFAGTAVVGNDFKNIKLSDFKGKYVVLVFYPLDFTFVCPTELIALDERLEDFHKLNAEVIGCSVDSHYSHLGWMNTDRNKGGLGPIKYPILSDLNKNISKEYGVLLEAEGVALRGTFIIDPKGILRQITINDLPIGRSVDETLRLIEALKFVEEHGEVCPANWKKGSKTIKPDPKGSQEYFASANN